MKKRKVNSIGIIAEDDSDVESLRILIANISQNKTIGYKKFVGKGCGKLKRKCNAWASQLHHKGCNILILVHDLDKSNLEELRSKLEVALKPCRINKYLICIPVQEFEAWLLSDPQAIKDALSLKKTPKIKGNPETINSPKEYLYQVILIASNNEKIYINTKHNEKIAAKLSIDLVKKRCRSFVAFYEFIFENCLVA